MSRNFLKRTDEWEEEKYVVGVFLGIHLLSSFIYEFREESVFMRKEYSMVQHQTASFDTGIFNSCGV